MIQVIINVASFSFQISGAIILLLSYLTNADQKIKRMCLDEHTGPLWGIFDKDGLSTPVSKEQLQSNAKIFYKNSFAFLNILIGYTCAIFSGDINVCPYRIFTYVVFLTISILIIEILASNGLSKLIYREDQKIKTED